MPRERDPEGGYTIQEVDVEDKTIIYDRARSLIVMIMNARVVLSPGDIVELVYPNVNAAVLGSRLLASTGTLAARMRVDVEVPQAWWDNS